MAAGDALIPAWLDGTLTPLPKLEVHWRGLRHKAVSVFVLRAGAVLLQRRAAGKYHSPGLWANTCCTHPHPLEADEDCARRRLREELGITGLELRPRGIVEYRANVGGGMTEHEVVAAFTAQAGAADMPLAPDPHEVAETRWVPLAALAGEVAGNPGDYTPWLRIYMAEHADMIFAGAAAP